jgi:NAD(P)-dependent dehydrogenase (short-subunit alcohol dehydrogenase family)
VTGGAKGIGRMISEGFVSNGATVYVSSRDAAACAQACDEMNRLGKGRAAYIAADLYKEEDLARIADELKKKEGSEFCLVLSCRVLSCRVLSCHVLSCLVMSCLDM